MFHLNTERLIDYWQSRKGEARIPPRSSIDPGDFVDLLPQIFILGRTTPGAYSFRLVGGLIADLHRSDLRQRDFLSLWTRQDRSTLQMAMEATRRTAEPIVISCEASSAAGQARFEMALAPLAASPAGEASRFLGLLQPTSSLTRMAARPVERLTVRTIATNGSEAAIRPYLRLAALDGRLTA